MTNKHWKFINRYGDTDKHWWRLRYTSPEGRDWKPTGIMFETHGGGYDESQRTFNILNVSLRGRNLGLILPALVQPFKKVTQRVTLAPLVTDTFTEWFRREFGFRFSEGSLTFHYGEQTHEWPGCKSKTWFYPWREWTHIRHSLYDDAGDWFADVPNAVGRLDRSRDVFRAARALEKECPVKLFLFAEDDGDLRIATCRIEEREWRAGKRKGPWRWLLAWKRNKVQRSLCIEYSGEVGRRKGSYKGGTIGTSIATVKDELPIEAFRRHCKADGLRYIGDVTEYCRTLQLADAKQLMTALHAHAMPSTVIFEWVEKIYCAGLVPIFDRVKQKLHAWPQGPVNAALAGDILPQLPKIEFRQPTDCAEAEIHAMMNDGKTEGQWAGHAVGASPAELKSMSEAMQAPRRTKTSQDAQALKAYWDDKNAPCPKDPDHIMPPPVQDAGPLASDEGEAGDAG